MPGSPLKALRRTTVRLQDDEREKLSWLIDAVDGEVRAKVAGWLQASLAAEREDVVQETFQTFAVQAAQGTLRCLAGQKILDIAREDLGDYLVGCRKFLLHVARNHCRRLYRRLGRYQHEIHALREFCDSGLSPELQLQEREDRNALHHALALLPGYVRGPLALCYFGNCSYLEAAEVLDIPLNTVKRRLHYGRRLLRNILTIPPSAQTEESPPYTDKTACQRLQK